MLLFQIARGLMSSVKIEEFSPVITSESVSTAGAFKLGKC